MDDLIDQLDSLSFNKEKGVLKMLELDEKILMTCMISKFNRKNKRQERNLLISTKAVYGLSKKTLKRKIPVSKIGGLTVSKIGSEFVLHVPDEYDYRYSSSDHLDNVLEMICKAFCETTKQKLSFFFKEELSLEPYCTTKGDKKKALSRMPTEGGMSLDFDALTRLLREKTTSID